MIKLRAYVALIAVLMAIGLSSCMKVHFDLKVTDKEHIQLHVDVGILQAFAGAMAGSGGVNLCNENFHFPATSKKPYADGQYVGCVFEGNINVDEINDLTYDDATETWKLAMKFNGMGGSSTSVPPASAFTSFKVSVTFPGEVLTHSGTSTVRGTTVTWTNPSDLLAEGGLYATAKKGPNSSVTPIAVIIGLLVIGGGVGWYAFAQSRKKQAALQAGPSAQVASIGQPMPNQQQPGAGQAGAVQSGVAPVGGFPAGVTQPGGVQPGGAASRTVQPGGVQSQSPQSEGVQSGVVQPKGAQPSGFEKSAGQPGALSAQPGAVHQGDASVANPADSSQGLSENIQEQG